MTFQELGINIKNKTSGQVHTICPQCSETRKKKNDPCLSVNIDEGIYNCHHCGWNGTTKFRQMEKKNYVIPQVNNTQLSDKALDWFLGRGISKATVIRFKLTESVEFMKQEEKEMTVINFNYFRDGKLVNIKFRDSKKNFKMPSGCELILYNLDSLLGEEIGIFCEGEIDCLSFYESGLYPVVSVPNGASKGNQNLSYLDNCISYLENKSKLYLATDADEPGLKLREALARRLGKERCWIIDFSQYGVKDANELLIKAGPAALKLAYDNALPYPIDGVNTVEKMNERIEILFNDGYPKGFKIGQIDFDNHFTPRKGDLTTVTGIPGSGKSDVLDFILMLLSVNHNWKFAVYSAENPEEIHFIKLTEKFTGKKWDTSNSEFKINREDLNQAKEFINKHFYWINPSEADTTIDGLLAKCKEMIFRYGIDCFILDPYNYIESKVPTGQTETQYISDVLGKLKKFARVNDIHIFLVAHPKKMEKENSGVYKVPTLYDIAGSAHFFNKTDNGITIYRDFDTNVTTVYIQKIRFNFLGKVGSFQLERDVYSGRYYSLGERHTYEVYSEKIDTDEIIPF